MEISSNICNQVYKNMCIYVCVYVYASACAFVYIPLPHLSLRKNNRLTNGSFISSMVLGALLALTFCPATASIFFGIMLPLSIKYHKEIIFPVIYGFGALLPVVIISIFITQGSMRYFKNKWTEQLPQVFGWALIVFGIYITLEHLYF